MGSAAPSRGDMREWGDPMAIAGKPRRASVAPSLARLPRPLRTLVAAAGVGALIFAFFGHAFLNYDTFYALVWGRQLAHGQLPHYHVPVAPTPHPLAIALGVPLSAFGDSAEQITLALVLLAIGFICLALYRLGSELYGWPVGLLAAALAATRVPPLNFGIRGYVDLPTIALILWAAVLEARRPRRGAAVLVLLALAGLLRPEAWLYAGAYWLWTAPPLSWTERAKLLAIAVAAPILWMLSDLVVTGDALWSLHGTHDTAAQLHRKTGLGAIPSQLPQHLGEILRLEELVASLAGFVGGLWWLRSRTLLPAAIAVLNGIAFLCFAVAGLSLIGRYLFLAGFVLCLFAALGALGWLALPIGHPVRAPARAVGAVLLLAIVALTPSQVGRLTTLRADIDNRYRVQSDLHALARASATAHLLGRCGRVFGPTHGQVPLLAYWTGTAPTRIGSAEFDRPTANGLYFAPASAFVAGLAVLDPNDPKRYASLPPGTGPPGYREIARNSSWVLFAGAC